GVTARPDGAVLERRVARGRVDLDVADPGGLVDRRLAGGKGLVEGVLLDVGQDVHEQGGVKATVADVAFGVRHGLVRGLDAVQGDAHLPEVVAGLDACGGLTDLLHGREQQADENGDNGDDYQKLDQREPGAARPDNLRSHGVTLRGNKRIRAP